MSSTTSATNERRVLLAYFSRAGENYFYGGRRTLQTGNTEVLARMIADRIDCDTFRIEAAEPYPTSYAETVERNGREEESEARPDIVGELPRLAAYDTVLLGSPVWNVQTPMIMRTFAESGDWTGKTIHPFVTYAVSGLGNVVSDYRQAAPGARVTEGLAVRGETVQDGVDAVEEWIAKINVPRRS